MHRAVILGFACAIALGACTSYEYEEEVFLNVDGSGQLRVSGSTKILEALHETTDGSVASMRSRFQGAGLTIDSVRETQRHGRKYVHVQGQFDDWNELCNHPAYRHRACHLEQNDDGELELHLTLPSPGGNVPPGVPSDALLALRFHFPSRVRFHNSSAGIERGNIVGWEQTIAEHLSSPELVVDARFEQRSVLATTVAVLGTAIAAVLLTVVFALFLMVRKGQRQLATQVEAEGSLDTHTSTTRAP